MLFSVFRALSAMPTVEGVPIVGAVSGKVLRMDVRRWVAAAVCPWLVCVPLLGVAGCSDDSSGAGPREPTTSASPSPTPSETGPTIPPEAMGTDEASAKAFVAHYLDVLNSSTSSGQTGALAALGKPACVTCSALVKNISDAYADGGYVKADGWKSKKVVRADKRQDMVLVVSVEQGRERFYSADGQVVRRFGGGQRDLAFYLAHASGSWVVWRLDLLS